MIGAFRSSLGLLLIEGFPSLSFRLEIVSSVVHNGTEVVLCCLIVDVHASGIATLLSLLMLSGWSLMGLATLTVLVPVRVSNNKPNFDPEPIVPSRSERAVHCITSQTHMESLVLMRTTLFITWTKRLNSRHLTELSFANSYTQQT